MSHLDIEKSGPIKIDGEWAFYPGQLLSPQLIADTASSQSPEYLSLPSPWSNFARPDQPLEGKGIATFRLMIIPPQGTNDLALRLFDVRSAYRLWLNGKLISYQGKVSEDENIEVPRPTVDLPVFRNDGQLLDLVLEVSNHLYPDGGVTSSIMMGTTEAIKLQQYQKWGISLFFLGSLLMMACYHLCFYHFRRNSPSSLYFGLYCLLWFCSYAVSSPSDWVVQRYLPELSTVLLHRLDFVCFSTSMYVCYAFLGTMFPDDYSNRFRIITLFTSGIFIVVCITTPVRFMLSTLPYYYVIAAVTMLVALAQLVWAWHMQRVGAGLMLVGYAILGASGINDMLYDLRLIRSTYLIDVGLLAFVLAQGFVLAKNYSRNFSAVEALSVELDNRNQSLQNEMNERTRLELEIINVSENERRGLSRKLHDGLCQQLTAARLRCAVLEQKQGDNAKENKELFQLSSLLEESVNHAYDLSRGLWPVEHDELGNSTFLEEYCQRQTESSDIAITVKQRRYCLACNNKHLIQLYRIAQEAITNAVKHAKASRIEVTVDCSSAFPTLVLSVEDNGVGRKAAAPSPGGLGMRIMAYRAQMIGGELQVNDRAEGGTEVVCRLRCNSCHEHPE